MRGTELFEYAVVRVVPRVEREEFLNVGVILYCPSREFLRTKCYLDSDRLSWFCRDLSLDELSEKMKAFDQICQGLPAGGVIARLPMPSRFRWLTAAKSTVIQTSPVHPGLCDDPQETLDRLYAELVA
jgi:Protein of unknown function (DUF3037)